jgi:hypothetical protein
MAAETPSFLKVAIILKNILGSRVMAPRLLYASMSTFRAITWTLLDNFTYINL